MTPDSTKPRKWFLEINKRNGCLLGFASDDGSSPKELYASEPPIGIEREIIHVVEYSALEAAQREIESFRKINDDDAHAIYLRDKKIERLEHDNAKNVSRRQEAEHECARLTKENDELRQALKDRIAEALVMSGQISTLERELGR